MDEGWPSESIPDGDTLFMRVHRNLLSDGQLTAGVFKDREGGMSTNWQKYCVTADEARAKAKKPEDNGVIQLAVGGVRNVPLSVIHSPDRQRDDRSHTDVMGNKSSEVRLKLLSLATWSINLSDGS